MKWASLVVMTLILLSGSDGARASAASFESRATGSNDAPPSLSEARKSFQTRLTRQIKGDDAVAQPPPGVFDVVKYQSPVGMLSAYLSPAPHEGGRHPVIIWITGGDCNSIGDVWSPAPRENDQTAAAYRKAGILMMFPSLRGGNNNPGAEEKFCGEVDDVLAAADFLAKQAFIDSGRIYLGGHSTGGTLTLLLAECPNPFRAIFSFGPVEDIRGYSEKTVPLPFDTRSQQEFRLRSPGYWLHSINTPTFVFEGSQRPSNVASLQAMKKSTHSRPSVLAHFFAVPGVSHFSILAPANELIAKKTIADNGATSNLSFAGTELASLSSR